MSSDSRSPKKKGLKIDNTNSSVPAPKPDTSAAFNTKAAEVHSKYEDYKHRAFELSSKFKSMIQDKTLIENKSILSKDIEIEVLSKLIGLASDMNGDDDQPEGIGSNAMEMLFMKMLLIQRDTINHILFKLEKLEKSIQDK